MLLQFLRLSLFLVFFVFPSLSAFAGTPNDLLVKALTSYEEKNFKLASSYFEKYFPSSDLLRDYVLFWWARSLKGIGKDEDAIRIYNKISKASPVRKKAVEDLCFLYKERKDWPASIEMIKERIALEKDKRIEPLWQKEALEAGYYSGKPDDTIDNFRKLIEDFSETQEALDALERYGHFYSFKEDELSRAKVYLNHGQFRNALECLEKIYLAKPGIENREALRLKAEACYGLKDYNQAISILKELIEEGGGDEIRLRLGEIYLSTLEEKEGLTILEKLAREKEGSKIACLSLWDLLNYWKRNDGEEKTKIYYESLRQGYRQFSLTDKAIWMEGWMDMLKKNYVEVDNLWKAYDTILRNSRQKMSSLYIRAWIKSSSNKEEAREIFEHLATIFPDTYYGVKALKEISFTPSIPEPDLKLGELGEENDFDRARALLKLARYEEAIFELESLKEKRYNDMNLRYNLSLIYGRANRFYESINEAESLIDSFEEAGTWPGFLHISQRELREINFPRFYSREVEKRAGEFRLDENLIYAVIREESRFNETDVSRSGAIGLMQIIPSTGKWIIEKTGMVDITTRDIFRPEINIFLGCWYLRYLLDKFNGDLLLAIASYNGGPGFVERWVESGGLENRDLAIEMMPKEETKYYCQKVLFSYYIYEVIYGKNQKG